MKAAKQGSTTNRINDLSDAITGEIDSVKAIMDAAKVLIALERAKAKEVDGSLATGDGYADGHVLRDATLPNLLYHGVCLLESVESRVEQMNRIALSGQEPLRDVANG